MADEEKLTPVSAATPPKANPLTLKPMVAKTAGHAATLKLKPLVRKDGAAPAAAPAAEKPAEGEIHNSEDVNRKSMATLKNITAHLKSVTTVIPQQAILHKTGIVSDPGVSEAQKQAALARTSRISLSEAIGAAPVSNENAPMKTIRIKRPVAPVPEAGQGPAVTPANLAKPKAPTETTSTKRRTLKIARPGAATTTTTKSGPAKLTIKKPGAAAPAAPTATAPTAPTAPAAGGEVADIPDIPDLETVAPITPAAKGSDSLGAFTAVSAVAALAACMAMGFLAWMLYQSTLLPMYCGGCALQ